jgi:nucleoside-diphosphate-sugar epimerase
MTRSDWKNVSCLITGATGFIGSHLVRRLVFEGARVHVLALSNDTCAPISDLGDSVVIHRYDGTTASVLGAIQKSGPEVVFHLASLFLASHTSDDVSRLIESNLLFSTQLLEGCTKNGVGRFVNTGTSWQHYQDDEYNPVCLYAATKDAFERIIRYYLEVSELKTITLKLFDTYGPGDARPKVISLFRRIALSGETLKMSPGEQQIDLVYIDDVVDAFLAADGRLRSGAGKKSESFAVSTGAAVSLKKLAEIFSKVIGKELNIEWGGRPYRDREVMTPWKGGRSLPGWQARIGLEEGLRLMLQTEGDRK